MRKSVLIVIGVIGALLVADHFHFRDQRHKPDAFTVSEEFLRKGVLGRILKEKGLIQSSAGSQTLATNDMCAEDSSVEGYDYHNTYRLRFKLRSSTVDDVNVEINFPKASSYRKLIKVIRVQPGRHFYALDFVAHKGLDFHITFSTKPRGQIILGDILVDGRFGRTQTLLKGGEPISGKFDKLMALSLSDVDDSFQGVELAPTNSKVVYSVVGGLNDNLYSGVFPGKKNHGFCRYVAYKPKKLTPVTQRVVPTVKLHVEEQFLYGEQGIVDNKEGKGRAWEVPVEYSVQNQGLVSQHVAGLRFHGGTPGRKKNINSFRVNARSAYGKPTLDMKALMGRERQVGMKGVVFKYTYHAYDLNKTLYNPYNHALALDVANAIGALVPAHQLVDLHINDESYGLYLAMEHLSKRSAKYWLGKDDIKIFTYKKFNDDHQKFALLYPIGEILKKKGEDAFVRFLESYDVDNVINSIILSAYVSDDDYCQGIEISDRVGDSLEMHITSVNWDLDHAFLSFDGKGYTMPVERQGIGQGFDILKQNKPHSQSLCPRKWVYSHLYTESKQFRDLIRQRLEVLLAGELSPKSVGEMLDKYRVIDDVYYAGGNKAVIDQMQHYSQKRPAVLLQRLLELELSVEGG